MLYEINVDDSYEVPAGELSPEQYLEFVLNKAAESYMKQYNAADKKGGIEAACTAYNAALPTPSEQPAE